MRTPSPVFGTQEARLLIHIADRTEITANDLIVGLLPSIISGHLKHAKVKVCDWAVRAAGYEDEWLLG